MLGWELPPHNSGGLGVACLNLSKSLAKMGADIDFVVPYKSDHHFDYMNVLSATTINPKYISLIVPARWYAGGKGLDEFRNTMLSDKRLEKIIDYPNPKDCFPTANISGGVCCFLWNRKYSNI